MVVEGLDVGDLFFTCLLGSFRNYIRDFINEQSLIISWTFMILLAHEEDQYTVCLENIKALFCP